MVKNLIVKCKGLPYSCTESELKTFLGGSGITKVDIPTRDGKALGDATVHFDDDRAYKNALKKDREHMGRRYIEVFPADEDRPARSSRFDRGGGRDERPSRFDRGPGPRDGGFDGYGYGGGSGRGDMGGPRGNGGGPGDVIVRIRGLPFGSLEVDVYDFFAPLPIVPGGVLLPDERYGPKGKGEAFIVFEDHQAATAGLQRHMKNIQHRYIEVFEASYQEMQAFCEEYRLRPPRMPATPGSGDFGPPPMGRGGYDGGYGGAPPAGYGMPPGPGGPPAPAADYGYTRSPAYQDRRPAPAYEPEPMPPAAYDRYSAARAPEPAARDPYGRPADPYARSAPAAAPAVDPYGRPVAPAAPVDPYARPSAPAEDPYGRRPYPAEDPYARAPRDPYERERAAPAADPYGRPAPTADTWRDDREPAPRGGAAPAAAGYPPAPAAGYPPADSWEGYGYGADYRQQPAGGPMRREREREPAAGGGGGNWRDERREPRDVPRGRERPGQKYVLKMRGVPFRAVEADVYDFFEPIRPASVEIVREPGGRPSGEARVEFDSRKDYDDALLKDKQYMGSRYVELFPDFGGRY